MSARSYNCQRDSVGKLYAAAVIPGVLRTHR